MRSYDFYEISTTALFSQIGRQKLIFKTALPYKVTTNSLNGQVKETSTSEIPLYVKCALIKNFKIFFILKTAYLVVMSFLTGVY